MKRKKQNAEKREREVLTETDPEAMAELNETEAAKRIKERMSLKHKNTSKWAKMALQYGVGDKSLRDAYHESVALGHELSKKIDQVPAGSGDKHIESDSEDFDSDEDDEGDEKNKRRKIAQKTARKIEETLQHQDENTHLAADGKYKKLLDMDFMKKAREIKQHQARQEAQDILKELAEMENASDSSDDSGDEKDGKKAAPNHVDNIALKNAEKSFSSMLDDSGSMTLKMPKSTTKSNDLSSSLKKESLKSSSLSSSSCSLLTSSSPSS